MKSNSFANGFGMNTGNGPSGPYDTNNIMDAPLNAIPGVFSDGLPRGSMV